MMSTVFNVGFWNGLKLEKTTLIYTMVGYILPAQEKNLDAKDMHVHQ